MRKLTLVVLSLWPLLPAFTSSAAGFTNQFNSAFDFVARGIIGNTNWDGVYLDYGDVLNGDAGGDGNGVTIQANETNTPGTLTVQTSRSTWAGAGDDGFFAYKVVAGDFDASVVVYYPFGNSQYHLPGLMARAFNPNGQGTPYSTTSTNSVENWLYLARFQEYNINEHVRYATNGADVNGYIDTPGDNSDTNSTRYLRLTRVGDVFTFYDKTNQADAWNMIGTLARPDLDGVAMQVGIKDESGTGNSPYTYFTDFELSGPNVTFPVMPPAPSGLQVTYPVGAATFSWTPGNPDDSSLVVMRALGNIQHNPVNGLTYNFDSTFGDTNACLGGGNEFVVYNGHESSVTVSNLGGAYLWYTVAVYEYSGSGSSTVYNTASPATAPIAAPPITSVAVNLSPTNIPVGGVAFAKLLVNAVVSSDPSIIWSSSDPTVATVEADGLVNGVGAGSASITGALKGFQAPGWRCLDHWRGWYAPEHPARPGGRQLLAADREVEGDGVRLLQALECDGSLEKVAQQDALFSLRVRGPTDAGGYYGRSLDRNQRQHELGGIRRVYARPDYFRTFASDQRQWRRHSHRELAGRSELGVAVHADARRTGLATGGWNACVGQRRAIPPVRADCRRRRVFPPAQLSRNRRRFGGNDLAQVRRISHEAVS